MSLLALAQARAGGDSGRCPPPSPPGQDSNDRLEVSIMNRTLADKTDLSDSESTEPVRMPDNNSDGIMNKKPSMAPSEEESVDRSSMPPPPSLVPPDSPALPASTPTYETKPSPVGTPMKRNLAPLIITSSSPPSPFAKKQPQNAVKVIKGEIHNVLNVMRADSRYSSPLRFVQELPLDEHPLLQALRELHQKLSVWELTTSGDEKPDLVWYITPFCTAILERDISASITGAALSALHKFLLYGFITPETPGAAEGMTLVAKAVLHCTFEESSESRGSGSVGSGEAKRHSRVVTQVHDEEVVLKLLGLSALVVRCSLMVKTGEPRLLDAPTVLGLLDTCLHVSHRARTASALLRSAAGDALGQIVLVVFGTRQENDDDDKDSCRPFKEEDGSVLKARAAILSQLASLVNPLQHSDSTCVTSLTLINIALETMRHTPSDGEISVLQDDLCKHLLQLSTTNDLVILCLTLRVIFNLFQTIRNHLKVPLEVFLTSVHLRILDPSSSASNEQKEVALESLLEFCQEPALMQDLYLNYDCDVHCTNLFETICTTLARVSELVIDDAATLPASPHSSSQPSTAPPLNALNRLAIEGILAVIDSIARRCQSQGNGCVPRAPLSNSSEWSDTESETSSGNLAGDVGSSQDDLGTHWEAVSSEEAQRVLQQRKRKKHWMAQAASEFNRRPMGKEWIQVAERSNLLPAPATPEDVASFLYTTPHLDKTQMGLYLSKGPELKYPFHAEVRKAFVSLFDFRGMPFSEALRKFLLRFRLPGEAQCIDRLMEAFSAELYEQQELADDVGLAPPTDSTSQEPTTTFTPQLYCPDLEPLESDDSLPRRRNPHLMPFRNADAVYVLAFSTIMLNTDLHNPQIKDERRMTLEQFKRNNKGINDGEDLPDAFLTELYKQIKNDEIQVQKELADVRRHSMEGGEIQWDGLLSKSDQVTKPFFTPAEAARRTIFPAGVHERDMFLSIAKSALECISNVFVRSFDDVLVIKTLKGFKQMAKICVYFGMDETLNEILNILLAHGRDYIIEVIVSEYAGEDNGAKLADETAVDTTEKVSESEFVSVGMLVGRKSPGLENLLQHQNNNVAGSSAHRGLLALDLALTVIGAQKSRLREAWPMLIECLCALRDARALPVGLADLDDFADSHGTVLPPSLFARLSQQHLDEYYRSLSDSDENSTKSRGWFKFFKTEQPLPDDRIVDEVGSSSQNRSSSFSKTLLAFAEGCELEQVILTRSNELPQAKQTIRALLDAIDVYQYDDDAVFEQHAVFSLELAARAFFSNMDRATELFPMFLSKFETILGKSDNSGDTSGPTPNLEAPLLTERVVVTTLRACIHLFDTAEVRPQLMRSLHLLMALPAKFTRHIADRFSCGMAIVLRGSFYLFETAEEWKVIGDMLDMLSHFGNGRGFVFDGIAATVEYTLPSQVAVDRMPLNDGPVDGHEVLSYDGCAVFTKLLTRFCFGDYQSDRSLSVPAVVCLEKVYGRMVDLGGSTSAERSQDMTVASTDHDLWGGVAAAMYSVCRSSDATESLKGLKCFESFLQKTLVTSLPDANWIAILEMVVSKQAPLTAEVARINTFTILGQVLLIAVAHLSHRKENWEDLTDIIHYAAALVEENLREGRRGTVSPLFEHTVQTVTYMSNHMVTEKFGGDPRYSQWASETLLLELEKVGASGGSFKNVAAITKQVSEG